MAMRQVGTFDIPEELAHHLSDLLIKQSIRERLLTQVIDDPVKYESAENMLAPVAAEIARIKYQITQQYVPEQYQSEQFSWNYQGWEIAQNHVQVLG